MTFEELYNRVDLYERMLLPGQPKNIHTGTSTLIHDLLGTVHILRTTNARMMNMNTEEKLLLECVAEAVLKIAEGYTDPALMTQIKHYLESLKASKNAS